MVGPVAVQLRGVHAAITLFGGKAHYVKLLVDRLAAFSTRARLDGQRAQRQVPVPDAPLPDRMPLSCRATAAIFSTRTTALEPGPIRGGCAKHCLEKARALLYAHPQCDKFEIWDGARLLYPEHLA
jgi:hypothetical protein